jgi:UDP-N-acetylglucosamine--N-acetylmuramyl-(pentapeptide) pyrophosphoryl-undecaprenol N-acetylglucosamine transferase
MADQMLLATAPPTEKLADPHALLSGGGTGGHVFPGLAVANELVRRGWEVSWAGVPDGMEEKLARQKGVPFYPLPARPMVGSGMPAKLAALWTLCQAALKARGLVRQLGARVVLGTGGYVSAGAALGARLAGVPLLLFEPNAEAGVANRWLSRLADEAFVAFEGTGRALRCASRLTGIPVRAEFFDVAEQLPFGAPLRVLVLGGSQGARQLNDLLPAVLAALPESLGRVVIRHQTGSRHQESARQAYEERGIQCNAVGWRPDGPRVQVELPPFIQDMATAMSESHLIVSRAGAITLAEICAAGRPAILLPLAIAGGHQRANAQRLVDVGAARVLDAKADAEALGGVLAELLGDRQKLLAMAAAARQLGRADAAQVIADRVEFWGGRS